MNVTKLVFYGIHAFMTVAASVSLSFSRSGDHVHGGRQNTRDHAGCAQATVDQRQLHVLQC